MNAAIEKIRNVALVAHDDKKKNMLEWVKCNKLILTKYNLYSTSTTGSLIEKELGIKINKFRSGILGGDQQIGAKIAEGIINFCVFFWDPLESHPHDTDVKALLRIAVVWNIPVACNIASADFMISSSLIQEKYERIIPDYNIYGEEEIKEGIYDLQI